MTVQEKIKQLKSQGIPIYSISKLNTMDECLWSYWLTYMEHLPSKENIYTFAGTKIHSCLERIQNGEKIDFRKEFQEMLADAQILGIDFPSESIKTKWVKNIQCFIEGYNRPDYKKFETEKLFLIKIHDYYIQGIIDLLIYNDDGTVSIIDYKTSSKFSNSELKSKGRQLVLYGMAMEQLGYKVKSSAWNMLKYCKISYPLKNGKIRETIAERGYVLEKLKSDIIKEMKNFPEYDDFTAEGMIAQACEDNSFDGLPLKIKEKYRIEDYIVEYDFSEENKKDLEDFVKAKVGDIEQFSGEKEWWEPKELTPYNTFFCENLCSFSDNCEYYQEFKKILEASKEDKEDDEEDNIFF